MIFASVSTHGATGTWRDEILELGVPLVLFVGLWWWSTRKEKKKAKSTRKAAAPGAPAHEPDAKK
jgi:cyanate permease